MPQVPLPRVPDSTRQTPQVTAPGVTPVQDTSGQQIQQGAKALGNLGAHVTDIAARMNEDHALATSKSGLNEFAEKADGISQGYTSRVGRGAVDVDGQRGEAGQASAKVIEQIEAEMRSVEDGLPTELSKSMFRQHAERAMVSIRSRLVAHEINQTKAYDHGENVATVGRHARNYIANGDKPGEDSVLQMALAAAREVANDAGLGDEQRDAYLLGKETEMHAGRVDVLLAEPGGAKAADAYLRSIPVGNVDVLERTAQRKKIDKVLSAERVSGLAVGIVNSGGLLPQDVPSPTKQQETLRAAVTQASGLGARDNWQELLSDPGVIGNLPDDAVSLDIEIARSRHPGQRSANYGLAWQRSLRTIDAMLANKQITADQVPKLQRAVEENIRNQVQARDLALSESLDELKEVLAGLPPGTTVDSPVVQSTVPRLVDTLTELGGLSQARGLLQKHTSTEALSMYWDSVLRGPDDPDALGNMSRERFRSLFIGRLQGANLKMAYSDWQERREGKTLTESALRHRARISMTRMGLLSDVDDKGVGAPSGKEEIDRMQFVDRDIVDGKVPEDPKGFDAWLVGVVNAKDQRYSIGRNYMGYGSKTLYEATSKWNLQHQMRAAALTPAKDDDDLWAKRYKLKQTRVTHQGVEKWIRHDGRQVTHTVDPQTGEVSKLTPRLVQIYGDTLRMEDLERRLPAEAFKDLKDEAVALGALDWSRSLGSETREALDELLKDARPLGEGKGMISLSEQLDGWSDYIRKTEASGALLAPRRVFTQEDFEMLLGPRPTKRAPMDWTKYGLGPRK